jgi:hypothetical protein
LKIGRDDSEHSIDWALESIKNTAVLAENKWVAQIRGRAQNPRSISSVYTLVHHPALNVDERGSFNWGVAPTGVRTPISWSFVDTQA